MLTVEGIGGGYGRVQVLRDLSFQVAAGEILCLLGRNGAGKTTTMKAIMGLVRLSAGRVRLGERTISSLPAHKVPAEGLGYVPQGRRLFAELTVEENLEIGLMARGRGAGARDRALDLFPALRARLTQRSGTLSGGEQQMLAMARALCVEPSVLLLDEPTEGLMPSMIERIREATLTLRQQGTAVLLVEQRVDAVLAMADRVAFIENGRNADTVAIDVLKANRSMLDRYVGVGQV